MTAYPHNKAPTTLPILSDIAELWSPRAFFDQPVEEEKIRTLFEAARWAPSNSNMQPWHYLYATKEDGDQRTRLESLLMEGNSWAKTAPLLLIGFAYGKRKKSDSTLTDNTYAMYDTGSATGYLALQCVELGLIGHQMGGFASDKANEVLGVPADFLPGSMMAIGYPGDIPEIPARVRKTQEEFVFRGEWKA